MSVITALELHDGVAPGEGASQPDRAHGRLGAGAHEAHQLDGRHERYDAARKLRFKRRRGAEAQAVRGDLLHGLDDLRMSVTQDHGSPGADVIDVAPIVRGEHVRALGFLEENRLAADAAKSANGRVDAARNVLAGFLKQAHSRASKQRWRPRASSVELRSRRLAHSRPWPSLREPS